MSIETAIATGLTPTSTGNVSFEVAGFGTPQAAIIYVSRAISGTNPREQAAISCGFTDGVRRSSNSFVCQDNVGTTSTDRYSSVGLVINVGLAGATTVEGDFSSWATNGITINFSKVSTVGFFVTVVLIKGCTSAKTSYIGLGTGTSPVDINTIGFKPNLVFLTSIGNSSTNNQANAILSMGVAHNNSSDVVTEGQIAFSSVDAQSTEVASVVTRDDSCIGQLHNGSQTWRASASAFDSSGFSLTPNVSSGSDIVYYLALDTGDEDGVDVSIIDSPTSTGTLSVEDPAFTPQLAMLFMGSATTTNTLVTTDPMYFGVSVFNETTEACVAIDVDDGASTTDTQSNYATKAVQTYHYSGGHVLRDEATLTSFDSLGYDLNFTTSGAFAKKWLSVSIKEAAADVGTITTMTPDGEVVTISANMEAMSPSGSVLSIQHLTAEEEAAFKAYWASYATRIQTLQGIS